MIAISGNSHWLNALNDLTEMWGILEKGLLHLEHINLLFHSPNVNVCIRNYEVAKYRAKQRKSHLKEREQTTQQRHEAENNRLRLHDLQKVTNSSALALHRPPTHRLLNGEQT